MTEDRDGRAVRPETDTADSWIDGRVGSHSCQADCSGPTGLGNVPGPLDGGLTVLVRGDGDVQGCRVELEIADQQAPLELPGFDKTFETEFGSAGVAGGQPGGGGDAPVQERDVVFPVTQEFVVGLDVGAVVPGDPLVEQPVLVVFPVGAGLPTFVDLFQPVPEVSHRLGRRAVRRLAELVHDVIDVGIHIPLQGLDVVVLGSVECPVAGTLGDVGEGSQFIVAPFQELLGRSRIVAETQERSSVHVRIEVDRPADGPPLLGLLELAVQDKRLGHGHIGFELESRRG